MEKLAAVCEPRQETWSRRGARSRRGVADPLDYDAGEKVPEGSTFSLGTAVFGFLAEFLWEGANENVGTCGKPAVEGGTLRTQMLANETRRVFSTGRGGSDRGQ